MADSCKMSGFREGLLHAYNHSFTGRIGRYSWHAFALEAVLADARARGLTRFVNLGDTFYGPLDPVGTWRILRELDIPTVLGNQDRLLLEGGPQWEKMPAYKAAVDASAVKEWLGCVLFRRPVGWTGMFCSVTVRLTTIAPTCLKMCPLVGRHEGLP